MRAPLICGFIAGYRCSDPWSNWVTVRRSKAYPWLLYDLARSPAFSLGGKLSQKPQRAAPTAATSRSGE